MATRPPKPRTVKPAAGTCTLTLTINDTPYAVIPLRPDPGIARRALRLRKEDGTTYDLALTEHGPQCSCPDFLFHRDGKDRAGCKHLKACRAWGLLTEGRA